MQFVEPVGGELSNVGGMFDTGEYEGNAGIPQGFERVVQPGRPAVEQRPRDLEAYLVDRKKERVGDLRKVLLGAYVGDQSPRHGRIQA